MPEHGIPIELETPRGVLPFNRFGNSSYLRVTEFAINAAVRASVEPIARRDGSIVPDAFRSGATPILKGEAKASTMVDRASMLDDVRAHLISILRADGILRWTPTGQATRRMVVRCLEDPTDSGTGWLKSFHLAMVSRTAHAVADVERSATMTALDGDTGGGSWSFPFSFPMTFGGGVGPGAAIVVNGGNADTHPILRLTGPLTNPSIRNLTTGKELSLQITIPAGSFLLIDMAAESLLMNGDPAQSQIGSIDPLSAVFWTLAEGVNEIRLFADAFGDGHGAAAFWRDGFS